MGIAKDKLLAAAIRPIVIDDCVKLVDSEVAAKSGMTGLMIKGGYKAFKAIKPSIVKDAVDLLLDDFVGVIDRHYEEYRGAEPEGSVPFEAWAKRRDAKIADDMLGITDRMMERSSKTALVKIYKGLRGVAERNVAQAVPGVARIVAKHAG